MQQASSDPVVATSSFAAGVFSVPARTTAVFVAKRAVEDQVSLLRGLIRPGCPPEPSNRRSLGERSSGLRGGREVPAGGTSLAQSDFGTSAA